MGEKEGRRGRGEGKQRGSKKYLAGLWGNSDFEPTFLGRQCPKWDLPQRLAKTAKKRVYPGIG
jgi:hypothetical protein